MDATDRPATPFVPACAASKVRVVVPDDAPAQGYLTTLSGFSRFQVGQSVDDPNPATTANWTGGPCHRSDPIRGRQMLPQDGLQTWRAIQRTPIPATLSVEVEGALRILLVRSSDPKGLENSAMASGVGL